MRGIFSSLWRGEIGFFLPSGSSYSQLRYWMLRPEKAIGSFLYWCRHLTQQTSWQGHSVRHPSSFYQMSLFCFSLLVIYFSSPLPFPPLFIIFLSFLFISAVIFPHGSGEQSALREHGGQQPANHQLESKAGLQVSIQAHRGLVRMLAQRLQALRSSSLPGERLQKRRPLVRCVGFSGPNH